MKPQKDENAARDDESKIGKAHNNYALGVLTGDLLLAADFLSAHVPRFLASALDWSKLGTEPTVYVDEKLKGNELDVAFAAPYAGFSEESQRFVIIVEHKSRIERQSALQLLRYCVNVAEFWRVNDRKLSDGRVPWPLPILLYNGPKELKNLPTIQDAAGADRNAPCAKEFEERFVPNFEYCAIDLATLNFDELSGGPLVRAFLEVLKRGTDGTLSDAVRELNLPWLAKDNAWNDYPKERLEKFFELTFHYISYSAINSNKPLSAADYRRMFEATDNARVKTEMKTFIDEFREEGRAEGLAEGLAEGRVEGLAEGRAESILESIQYFLEDRFGETPSQLLDRIDAIADYPSFEKIQRFSWHARSLSEVERFVGQLEIQEQD